MTTITEVRELSIHEFDLVAGGGLLVAALAVVGAAVGAAIEANNR
jgi:hypothetical protein